MSPSSQRTPFNKRVHSKALKPGLNYQFLHTSRIHHLLQYISQSTVLDIALLTKDLLQQASVMKWSTFFFSTSRDDSFPAEDRTPDFCLKDAPDSLV
ncbi:hypothetical protein CDAR_106351 [Caerostris darwini]|uniref:Uncharacterized protein n=1 Tax=Caerostris darwini TaxID=1538125 RepID=A0AAV4SNB7_9ARAC|nr:hypothetical protein CDAR_106351 [Caerostris darwini]